MHTSARIQIYTHIHTHVHTHNLSKESRVLDSSGADKRAEANGGIWPGLPSSIPLRQVGLPPTVSQIMDMATVHPRPHVLQQQQQKVPKEQKSELGSACLYRQHLGGGGRKT